MQAKSSTKDLGVSMETGGGSVVSLNGITNGHKKNASKSEANRIFRHTINLIIDSGNGNRPASSANSSISSNSSKISSVFDEITKNENLKKAFNSKNSSSPANSSATNISKNLDTSETDELDNINITVNLFNANTLNSNNNCNDNKNSSINHLTSDLENDSMNNSKAHSNKACLLKTLIF